MTAPAHSPNPSGYEPTQLDETIKSYIATCEKNITVATTLGAKVEEAVKAVVDHVQAATDADMALARAEDLTRLHERLSKANLNLVKGTDELTRLRSFLAGGPDSRPDLSSRGEIDLLVIVMKAVESRGWKIVQANDGTPVEVLV